MSWLEIKDQDLDKNIYILEDNKEQRHMLVLKFLDLDEAPKIGDSIHMNEQLLDVKYAGYSPFYTFGSLDNKYGKKDIALDDIDVIKLTLSKKLVYLKRLYG